MQHGDLAYLGAIQIGTPYVKLPYPLWFERFQFKSQTALNPSMLY